MAGSSDWRETERKRVAGILVRDAAERAAEQKRRQALIEVEDDRFVNIEDTVLPPTDEWLAKHETVPYTPRGEDGTVRSVKTVRRKLISQVVYLLSHGVLDDDLFAACKWYKERWEAAEMEPSAPVASYGESVRGDPAYGHLARSEVGAEARSDFRFARSMIPGDVVDLFDNVILRDMGLTHAARAARSGYVNTRAAFMRAALALHGGIAHRLETDRRFER